MIRLHQKHSKNLGKPLNRTGGPAIVAAQSLPAALLAALATVLVLNVAWMISAAALNRVLPWYVIVQGPFVGLAVRRWGRGLDWRFPLLAAVMAMLGAYSGNFLLAVDTAADEFGVGLLKIVLSMSEWTLGTYVDEVVGTIDHIYALGAAAIAAFLAKRHLTREEEYAVRTYQDDESRR